jgi:hypothetical protein
MAFGNLQVCGKSREPPYPAGIAQPSGCNRHFQTWIDL